MAEDDTVEEGYVEPGYFADQMVAVSLIGEAFKIVETPVVWGIIQR